jgi:hypothetical protein
MLPITLSLLDKLRLFRLRIRARIMGNVFRLSCKGGQTLPAEYVLAMGTARHLKAALIFLNRFTTFWTGFCINSLPHIILVCTALKFIPLSCLLTVKWSVCTLMALKTEGFVTFFTIYILHLLISIKLGA